MCNEKEKFNQENFLEEELTQMIYSAMDLYFDFVWETTYICVSYETLKAEKASLLKR